MNRTRKVKCKFLENMKLGKCKIHWNITLFLCAHGPDLTKGAQNTRKCTDARIKNWLFFIVYSSRRHTGPLTLFLCARGRDVTKGAQDSRKCTDARIKNWLCFIVYSNRGHTGPFMMFMYMFSDRNKLRKQRCQKLYHNV
jgi:hypothetical protein